MRLDLDIKHDHTITFDYMEGYNSETISGYIDFPFVGTYVDCTIKSNDNLPISDAFTPFPTFYSCNINAKGTLTMSYIVNDEHVGQTQCYDCSIICGNFASAANNRRLAMQNTSLTVTEKWYTFGASDPVESRYIFNSCTVDIHELTIIWSTKTEEGFFDGIGSDITIGKITRPEGLDCSFTCKGSQNFTLPSECKTKASTDENKVEIYKA